MIRPIKIHWEPREYSTHGALCLSEPGAAYPHRISYEGELCLIGWAPNAHLIHCSFTLIWVPGGSCCGDQGPRCSLIGPILSALPIEQLLCYRAPIEVKRITLGPLGWHLNGKEVRVHFRFRAPNPERISLEDASAEMQTVLVILDRTIARAFAESETPTAQAPAVVSDHAKTEAKISS